MGRKPKISKLDSLRGLPTGIERQAASQLVRAADAPAVPAAAIEAAKGEPARRIRRTNPGAPILLRLHEEVLGRLDRARGVGTRQETIRRILDEHLPV